MNRKTRLILFFVIVAVFSMGANFAHPVTPTLFQNLKVGDYMFGVALASMMSANFLVSPFWGKLNDYFSSKFSLLVGGIGYGVGQFLFSISQTEGQIIAARLFAGIFTAGAFVSILTYIVNTNNDNNSRGYYLALSATLQSICGAFGYLIGGLLGEISVKAAFMAQSMTLIACGIAFYFVCEKDAKISRGSVKIMQIVKQSNPFNAFFESRKFMTAVLFLVFVVVVMQNLGNTAFDQSFNYFLKDKFNFSSGYNGLIKGVMGITTLLVNATITIRIINKTDISKSIIYVFLAGSVMMVFAIIFSNIPMPFIFANIIYYACAAASIPLLQNLAAKSAVGAHSNLVMGLYNSMKSLGAIIGALVAGFLYNVEPVFAFYFGLAAYLTACVLSAVHYKKKKAVDENE